MYPTKLIIVIIILVSLAIGCAGAVHAVQYAEQPEFCGACHAMQPYYHTYIGTPHNRANVACHDCHATSLIGDVEFRGIIEDVTIPFIGDELVVTGEPEFRGSTMRMILLYHLDEYEMPSANVSTETCLGCHPMEAQHFANATCTACHTLHVARRAISMIEDCATCHAEPTAMVGAHVGVTCGGCHVRHEYTPNCVKCHRPHGVRYITNADCFSCHGDDPHHMVGIAPYPDVSKEACADCHVREYDVLKKYNEAHNTFVGEHRDALRTFTYDFASSCVDCHPQHPQAISCTAFGCHFNHPHRTMGCVGCHFEYAGYRCGTCHVDPHAPMASLEWTDWRRI